MALAARLDPRRFGELWRFYQAAVVNTLFGFGVYALFVRLGLDRYVAQGLAYLLGVVFNYLTYSRHVFRDHAGGKARFVAAYGFNYLLNLGFLKLLSLVLRSPYLAGFGASLAASLVNYLVLKRLVFSRRKAG